MARLSDIIEDFIKCLLDESQSSQLEIQRNELAIHFNFLLHKSTMCLTLDLQLIKGITLRADVVVEAV